MSCHILKKERVISHELGIMTLIPLPYCDFINLHSHRTFAFVTLNLVKLVLRVSCVMVLIVIIDNVMRYASISAGSMR